MKEFNFDYEQFVKEMIKQMPGNVAGITLQIFVDEFLAFTKTNRSKKTFEGVTLVCNKLLKYFSPLKKIDTIQLKEAENFLDAVKKNAPKGVYNYNRVLRAMWNKAMQWNYVRENPFEKVKLNKRQGNSPTFVTEEQLDLIIKNVDNKTVGDVIITAFFSGCRLGELVNLRWNDVNFKDGLITIGNSEYETKSRKQRIVPMHPRVREILVQKVESKKLKVGEDTVIKLPDKKGFVFCKRNGHKFTGDYFSRSFKRAIRKAELDEKLHFHCLRHGAATRMILNGAPLPSVQRILGHANIQTTMIYTHPNIEDLRDAVNRL